MPDWSNHFADRSVPTCTVYIYNAISRVERGIVRKQHLFSIRSALSAAEMSSEIGYRSSGADEVSLNLKETELTLALPGESRVKSETLVKSGVKRLFSETIDLNLGRSSSEEDGAFKNDASSKTKSPPARTQAVGWPPVRASRKNAMKRIKLVKVAVDGAPYLRKVDLEMYESYQQLLSALEDMFSCLAIRNYLNERKTIDPAIANGVEYVPTYEDRDGDWMLIGDVPWKMFVESCKKLRLMKSSDAVGLESLNCTNSN